MTVKAGTIWWAGDDVYFVVIDVIELEGHTWVHYRNKKTGQEYNCYQESFVARFRHLPE